MTNVLERINEKAKALNYNVIIEVVEPKEFKVGRIHLLDSKDFATIRLGKVLSKGSQVNEEIVEGSEVVFDCSNALELKATKGDKIVTRLLLVNAGEIVLSVE